MRFKNIENAVVKSGKLVFNNVLNAYLINTFSCIKIFLHAQQDFFKLFFQKLKNKINIQLFVSL